MKSINLIIVPALAIVLGITGCDDGSARSDYPDHSQETKAAADAIRSDRERREQAIDRELQQTNTSLAFTRQQNADKARLERERITLERDQKLQPLEAQKADVEAKAKRDCERVDQETAAKLATVNGEEAAKVRAEGDRQIAEIKSSAATKTADVNGNIRTAKQDGATRLAHVDEGEAKEQAALDAKRIEAENKAREARLVVASETTEKLDRLAKDSAQRQEKTNALSASDERITSAVRQDLARHGEHAQGVTIATDQGVVVLGGTVPNESVHREIVTDAGKIKGVVRVEDRIAVH